MSSFTPKVKEKAWDRRRESEISEMWAKKGVYRFDIDDKSKPIFVIDTPPPYPSGRPWHIGAAAQYSRIDMIARTARMLKNNVLFPVGIDRNGLPVEIYTEKTYKVNLHRTPREKFIELCRVALDDLEKEMIAILRSMGYSGNFESHRYRTDAPEYRVLTQTTFIDLWNKGLVYESTRPNNYCAVCGTTIADAEVDYEDLPATLTYVKFQIKRSGKKQEPDHILVATTRPELICACDLIIVNPEDDRYKDIQNKAAILPIYNREVKIKADPSADPKFGSGVVMVCSYGDYNDVLLFRKLGLKERVSIDERGRMTENAGVKYAGMKVSEARSAITQDLQQIGLVEKTEKITHRTPTCDRSGNPIEIIPMKEYYLKQVEFKDDLLKAAKEELRFFPNMHGQILVNWINSVTIDWPISRRRYYATEIPIWYCEKCNEPYVPPPGKKYYQPWKDPPPTDEPCRKCRHGKFVGDSRTFDTWMDSSVSPLFITKYLDQGKFFKKTYPTKIRVQGKDIVRTWLYYSILRCRQLTGVNPFESVWIDGMGLDEKGEKMSKSKGNVIDPIPILEKYGGDSFRLWSASEASQGYDFRISETKIAGTSKFLTKVWNIARFISSFPLVEKAPAEMTPTDKWILAELGVVVRDCLKGCEEFNFFIPANKLRDFTWNLFAPHYMEMAKWRAYGEGCTRQEQESSWYTLHACLKTVLLLLAPIIPYVTDSIWLQLYGDDSIHLLEFPKPEWEGGPSEATDAIAKFNSEVWNAKKAKGVSLKETIDVKIPVELAPYAKDLEAMHNIRTGK